MDNLQSTGDDNDPEAKESLVEGSASGPRIMNINANKGGMAGLDADAINRVMHEWSNGSNFHSFQVKRQQRIDEQIQQMKRDLNRMTEWQQIQCLKEADSLASTLESRRDMTRIIVHIDLDMFFAAVEMKHRPELVDKPIAVGSEQMLATSNYLARKFGVRPAMPGALAKRLCPDLIIIKHSFGSYSKESKEVMRIISDFDPNFCCMSLDECYIDLTEHTLDVFCHQNQEFNRESLKGCSELPDFIWDFAAQIVQKIRLRIHEETQLTASAGIACNSMIAKVCSDANKPNGQHMVRGNKKEIEDFVSNTQIRKICGIGPVRGQFLTALSINTCKDLWHKRDILRFAFSKINFEYYLRVGLGIGSTVILRDDEPKKSISCERTIKVESDYNKLAFYLKDMSDEVTQELKENNQICKTVTIKLKKWTFETLVRSQTLPYFTCDSETILNLAKKILSTELSNTPLEVRKYRLIGLRVSTLKLNTDKERVSSSQMTLSQIYDSLTKKSKKTEENIEKIKDEESKVEELTNNDTQKFHQSFYDTDIYECSVCSEKFKHKNLFEIHENDCIGQMFNEKSEEVDESKQEELEASESNATDGQISENFICPICSIQIFTKDNDGLNRHIDMCLNKDKCTELTKVPSTSQSTPKVKSVKRRVCSENKSEKPNQSLFHRSKKSKVQSSSSKSQKTLDFFFNSQ